MSNRRPLLVLIEGMDCSGKSTVIAALAARLRAEGWAVRTIDGGSLAPEWVNRVRAWACRDRSFELLSDLAHRTGALVDRLTFAPGGADVVLQHSYVHRQLAFEMTTNGRLAQAWSRLMARIAVRHEVRVLLTVEIDERICRYHARGLRTERKIQRFETAAGLERLRAMERTLERLAGEAGYVAIDTTGRSVEETVSAVRAEIDRRLRRPLRAAR